MKKSFLELLNIYRLFWSFTHQPGNNYADVQLHLYNPILTLGCLSNIKSIQQCLLELSKWKYVIFGSS